RSAGVGPLRVGGICSAEREPVIEAVAQFGAERLWWVGADLGAVGSEDGHAPVGAELLTPAGHVDDLVVEAAAGPEVPGLGGPVPGAPDDVVELEPVALLTAREGAAAVAGQDLSAQGRGDDLGDGAVGVLFPTVTAQALGHRVGKAGAVVERE